MYGMNDFDERFQAHARRTAAVDRDGWRKPQRARRSLRVAAAKLLIALAARIAPPHEERSATTTTFADMHGA